MTAAIKTWLVDRLAAISDLRTQNRRARLVRILWPGFPRG